MVTHAAQRDSHDAKVTLVARLVCLAGLVAAFPALLEGGFLPEEGDAVDYRRPMLDFLLAQRAYPNWPWSVVDDYPMLGELLMLPLHAVHPALARLVPLLSWVCVCAVAGKLGQLLFPNEDRQRVFWEAAAWCAGFRLVYQQVDLLMVDLTAAAFMLLCVWLSLRGRPALAGLWCGLGMATRYTMWPLAPAMMLLAIREQRGTRLKAAAQFVLTCTVVVVPHLVRNLLANGNPVFPLLGHLEDGSPADQAIAYTRYGAGHDLVSLLRLPWDILYTHTFVRDLYGYHFGKLFVLQVLALVLAVVLGRRARPDAVTTVRNALGGLGLFHVLAWFFTAQQSRFLTVGMVCLMLVGWAALRVRVPAVAMAVVLVAGLGSFRSVQVNAWRQVLLAEPSAFQDVERAARACSELIPPDAVVGHVQRGAAAFFRQPLRYLPPHPYALPAAGPPPEYVWGASQLPGHEPFPAGAPCVLRRVTPEH